MAQEKGLITWERFQGELQAREGELAALLPKNVAKGRFVASALAAVKQTPGLLKCTPRSLFSSLTKSAQDGLLPDGREGVIVIYREKQKGGSWLQKAQWNPMTFGLRKRARELDHILVTAQVVHEQDEFIWAEGDDPHLKHRPAPLGQDRGEMIGAYAIFRQHDGDLLESVESARIIHREIMDAAQIAAVRAQSKQPDGLLWGNFTGEAWKKTVVRRGFKSIPCSEGLQTVVQRDDDLFELQEPEQPKARVVKAQPSGSKPLPPVVGEPESDADEAADEAAAAGTVEEGVDADPEVFQRTLEETADWPRKNLIARARELERRLEVQPRSSIKQLEDLDDRTLAEKHAELVAAHESRGTLV